MTESQSRSVESRWTTEQPIARADKTNVSFRPGASESRQRLRSARPDGVRSDADLVIHGPLQNDKDLAAKAEGLVAHAMPRHRLPSDLEMWKVCLDVTGQVTSLRVGRDHSREWFTTSGLRPRIDEAAR